MCLNNNDLKYKILLISVYDSNLIYKKHCVLSIKKDNFHLKRINKVYFWGISSRSMKDDTKRLIGHRKQFAMGDQFNKLLFR